MRDLAEAIDAANAADPTSVVVDGAAVPLALEQGRRAEAWVRRLAPDAEPAALIAARAHHLRRWEVPRNSYPNGRAGYLRWRRDQKARHRDDIAALMAELGHAPALIARTQMLIERRDLRDPGAQLVEDAACLVFIELQLAEMTERLEHAKLVDVVRKTLVKMSPAAIEHAGQLPLPASARDVLAEAAGD